MQYSTKFEVKFDKIISLKFKFIQLDKFFFFFSSYLTKFSYIQTVTLFLVLVFKLKLGFQELKWVSSTFFLNRKYQTNHKQLLLYIEYQYYLLENSKISGKKWI